MPDHPRVGLVLSGGGAKGAYHVGVLKALVEYGASVDMLAGASIGALNAAVLASAPTLENGVGRLENLWMTLAESTPISHNIPRYISLLAAVGLRLNGLGYLDLLIRTAQEGAKKYGVQLPEALELIGSGMLSDEPIQKLMEIYLEPAALAQGLPVYVSVYKSLGGVSDVFRVLAAEFGLLENADSEFIHIQSLCEQEQKEVLLASAAIPILYAPRYINNSLYSDGGQGGWNKMQGNTPITPLLNAGCNMVIVTHLTDGSLWNRHDFPAATVLEIRPHSTISRDSGLLGGAKDLLGFDAQKIPSWIQQGYLDTQLCVGRVMAALDARNQLITAEARLSASEESNISADRALSDAMSRLK